MTREEEIRNASSGDLADILCEISNHGYADCDNCLASEYCHPGHTGFKDWLKKEVQNG